MLVLQQFPPDICSLRKDNSFDQIFVCLGIVVDNDRVLFSSNPMELCLCHKLLFLMDE